MSKEVDNLKDGLIEIKRIAGDFRKLKVSRITIGITYKEIEDRLVEKVAEQDTSPIEYKDKPATYFKEYEHFCFLTCLENNGKSAADLAKEIEREAHKIPQEDIYGLFIVNTARNEKEQEGYGDNANKVYVARW